MSDQDEAPESQNNDDIDLNEPDTPAPAAANPQQASTVPAASMQPLSVEQRDSDDQAHLHDVASGAIKPETYSDLMSKSTFGKIGAMFGLMLSGAGSGLTHQPNMLLEMMNNEIKNDLDAQKQTKANALNMWNATYGHELQRAQTQHTNALVSLAGAQTQQAQAGAQVDKATAKKILADTVGLAQYNAAHNNVLAGVYGKMSRLTDGNPAAKQFLDSTIRPAIEQQMHQNNMDTNIKQTSYVNKALQNSASTEQAPDQTQAPVDSSGVDLNTMHQMIQMGKVAPDAPGAINPSEVPQLTREAQDVAVNRNLAELYDEGFKQLAKSAVAGSLRPADREAVINSIALRTAKSTGAMSEQEVKSVINSFFPAPGDTQATVADKYKFGMKHYAGQERPAVTLRRYGLVSPFPQYTYAPDKVKGTRAPSNPKPEIRTLNNVQYVRGKNGEAVPVDQMAGSSSENLGATD